MKSRQKTISSRITLSVDKWKTICKIIQARPEYTSRVDLQSIVLHVLTQVQKDESGEIRNYSPNKIGLESLGEIDIESLYSLSSDLLDGKRSEISIDTPVDTARKKFFSKQFLSDKEKEILYQDTVSSPQNWNEEELEALNEFMMYGFVKQSAIDKLKDAASAVNAVKAAGQRKKEKQAEIDAIAENMRNEETVKTSNPFGKS